MIYSFGSQEIWWFIQDQMSGIRLSLLSLCHRVQILKVW
jgi:hypothetical protein